MIRACFCIVAMSLGMAVCAVGYDIHLAATTPTETRETKPDAGAPIAAPTVAATYRITTDHSGSQVNWVTGQLESVGIGYTIGTNERAQLRTAYTAKVVMLNEGRRVLPTIPIDAKTTLDAIARTDTDNPFDALINRLSIIQKLKDSARGTYTVIGTTPLYGDGGIAALAATVLDAKPAKIPKEQMTFTDPIPRGHTPQRFEAPYTGVIVNNDGVLIRPCLFPRLIQFDGEENWGPSQLTAEMLKEGPVHYADNLETAIKQQLAGERPLILEAVGNARGYYPILNVDDVVILFRFQKEQQILDKLPIIFTLGRKPVTAP